MSSSAERKIEITHCFNIPQGVTAPANLTPSGSQSFRVDSTTETGSAYYEGLLNAIREAKATTGAQLTEWRDAVGDAEKAKEASMKKPVSEEDEEDEEETVE